MNDFLAGVDALEKEINDKLLITQELIYDDNQVHHIELFLLGDMIRCWPTFDIDRRREALLRGETVTIDMQLDHIGRKIEGLKIIRYKRF
jgi:hypothetical protein